MLFKGFILKIALKIAWNVWSIQAPCAGGEAFLSEKCTGIPVEHKYFGLEHQAKLSHLPNNAFLPELDSFYQKPQLSCHLQGSCLWFLLKPWPASWPLIMNAEYQFKISNSQIKLRALPAKPWTAPWSSVWPMPFLPPPTEPANSMKSKVMLSCSHQIWTCCLFCGAVAKL